MENEILHSLKKSQCDLQKFCWKCQQQRQMITSSKWQFSNHKQHTMLSSRSFLASSRNSANNSLPIFFAFVTTISSLFCTLLALAHSSSSFCSSSLPNYSHTATTIHKLLNFRQHSNDHTPYSGLAIIRDTISKRRYVVFGDVARLPASIPANQALRLQVDLSVNSFPCSANWKRRPGHQRGRWVDQLHQDNHSTAGILERRYGPRWLCVNDDDESAEQAMFSIF